MNIGERIKILREQNNLSQIELARRLHISNSTLSQYENGTRTPSDDIKLKIASYFQVSTDYLLGNTKAHEMPKVPISDDDIKFALSGGGDVITDEQYEEVKKFVQFIKERDKK